MAQESVHNISLTKKDEKILDDAWRRIAVRSGYARLWKNKAKSK